MASTNKLIDDYITNSSDFANPVLNYLRELVHKTCPYQEEKMKWSFPHFDYKGAMMCNMAAFKLTVFLGFGKWH